ncbi:hypothetical protein C7S18_07885 [Ahniella affigens]|uniref:Cytochrome c family protein n=1 Tax=Ahniella affigens TaxID=2021234 RepID=A0A2P1PQI9_9GAMM|nr:hypothetical protein [Ahniella affigens]AVP97116.1 hypothetical protein C7S18_07885 [Ahniella affigens]
MKAALLVLAAISLDATAQSSGPVGCTYNQYGRVANGASLWPTTTFGIPAAQLPPFETNCLINQFAFNNFLYLAGNDGSGNPRFMSYVPWYDALPAKGVPVWTGTYTPLDGVQLSKAMNQTEAGNGFQLLDVANQTTSYDIRINQVYFNQIKNRQLYQQATLTAAANAFNQNSYSGGIWFPPTEIGDKTEGVIELKTAWRNFGAVISKLCPSDLMYCTVDDDGTAWGLVGFHLVQKTNTHGEFVWASFEHAGNAPDCSPGGANPVANFPADPTEPGQTMNVNKNYLNGVGKSGWNYFDYNDYLAAKGDRKSCPFPVKNVQAGAICLTWPGSGTAWQQVQVCRTDRMEKPANACVNLSQPHPNSLDIACLNQSVVNNSPSGLADYWRYYQLIGMQWVINGNTEGGAFGQGCFLYEDGDASSTNCPNYGKHGEGGSAPSYTRAGSTTMANTTLETWTQNFLYVTDPSNPQNVSSAADCFACHQPQTIAVPAQNGQPAFNQADMSHLLSRVQQ